MEQNNGVGNFQVIREEVKAIVARHGGKLNIEEWQFRGDECLRVLITWKRPTYSITVQPWPLTKELT